MPLEYKVIRIPLFEKKKRAHAEYYIEKLGRNVDVEKFVKQHIIEEYVDMKCLGCGYEERIPFSLLKDLMEMFDLNYPIEGCPKCEHNMVPKNMHRILKRQYEKALRKN